MLKFKKITMQNFLSVGNSPVEVALDENPITLITGPSGSGKSTVFLAISFALYGKTPRKVKKTSYANSINKKNCFVQLDFIKDGQEYQITRGMNPAILKIVVDGEEIEKNAASKDDQEWLESKFGYNYETFCQAILISLMSYSPFLTLEAAKRREVVDNIFGLSVFTSMNAVYKRNLSQLTNEVATKKNEIELSEMETRVMRDGIEEARNRAIVDFEKVNAKIERTKQNCKKLKSEIESIDVESLDLDKLNETNTKLLDHKYILSKQVSELKEEGSKLKKKFSSFNENSIEETEEIISLRKDLREFVSKRNEIEDTLKRKNKLLEDHKNSFKEVCFACNRPLEPEHVEHSKKAIADVESEINTLYKNLKTQVEKISSLTLKMDFIASSIREEGKESIKKEAAELSEILKQKVSQLESVEEEYASFSIVYKEANNRINLKTKLEAELAAEVKSGKELVSLKKSLEDSLKASNDKVLAEIEAKERLIDDKKGELNILLDKVGSYNAIGKLLKDNGLKAIMMKQYLDMTNSLMQKYIEMFNLDVKFSFNENFEETIKSRGRDEFEYFSLSSGERMRLDLAMLFTWREILKIRTGSSVNALFFDEVFDSSLDSDGRAALIPIFETLRGETNVFIISHSPDHLAENDVKHIEVRKVGGFSQYEEAV